MSKPISFGFGKSKVALNSKPPVAAPSTSRETANGLKSSLRDDSDNEDEEEPRHESVAGFSSNGAILSQAAKESAERVIKNAGNGDWRRRGRDLLPAEVRAARNGDVVMVERDEVSKASGLQFAERTLEEDDRSLAPVSPKTQDQNGATKKLTEDELALQALLDDGSSRPKTNAVIEQLGNTRLNAQDETADFRADVAVRPDSSTLEEYAAMPVEEFGMAMLRGMGQKRRANGDIINLSDDRKEEKPRKVRKQEGFLGIGAKAAPGSDVELGAWGKADMRKNNKGEGFFTPLMRENKATGERITEEEFQQRLKGSSTKKDEEDWRDRRDRNLERSGRDRDSKRNVSRKMLTDGEGSGNDYRDQMTEFSRNSSSSRKDRDRDERDHERSSARKDKSDRDYDSSRSGRDRSRSKERRRKRDEKDYDSRPRDKPRDKYRDDDRYDSSSSHRSGHRGKDEDQRYKTKT